MKGKILFVAGAAVGYVLGARAGRGAYVKIKDQAESLWENPTVQKGVQQAEGFVKENAPVVAKKAQDVANDAAHAVGSKANDDFMGRYTCMFGAHAPPVGSVGQSNYEGLRFLQAAAERAGSLALRPLAAAGRNLVYAGARGPVTIRNGRADMPIYLCEADGLDFSVLRTF